MWIALCIPQYLYIESHNNSLVAKQDYTMVYKLLLFYYVNTITFCKGSIYLTIWPIASHRLVQYAISNTCKVHCVLLRSIQIYQ